MLLQGLVMKDCSAYVSSVETFGSVDGPGIRFVVFLQGCLMRCKYCHNPETWQLKSKSSKKYSPKQLFDLAFRFRHYWGKNLENGGITVSGGEPLLQMDFLIEFFRLAKENGVHTAIDTSGQPFSTDEKFLKKFNQLMLLTDLFIVDIKAYDSTLHKNLTGWGNENILNMLDYLSVNNKKIWIRHVLVPNLTDSEKDLTDTKKFVSTLKTVEKVEILPYVTIGVYKWKELGMSYSLDGYSPPTQKQIERANFLLGTTK